VSWGFEIAKGGEFEVILTASCAKGYAGSEFVVSVGGQKLSGKTVETGDWGKFAARTIGRVKLDKGGKHTLRVQPKPKPRWRSMGLRSIVLKLK
jgi:hypothetical protein